MDPEETIQIDITPTVKKPRGKSTASKKAVSDFTDQVEIRAKDLPFLLGCWVRYYSMDSGEHFSGGNVREIAPNHVVLQAPFLSKDVIVPYRRHVFYCHPTLPQYSAVTRLRREWDQIRYEKQKMKRKEVPSKPDDAAAPKDGRNEKIVVHDKAAAGA